jgi:predicted nucleic acid-binding protein
MYLLDTCVISEGIQPAPNPDVDKWMASQPSQLLFCSAVSVGEIRYGIDRLPSGKKRTRLEHWFEEAVTIGLSGRVLPYDMTAAMHRGHLRANYSNVHTVDSQIAATALVHGLTVVTRNEKDFAFEGLSVFNPWRS